MGKGTFHARAEMLAVSPEGTRKFRRQDCATCAKETLFQGLKCLSCGAILKMKNKRGEVIKYDLKSTRAFNLKQRGKIRRFVRSLGADKAAYYRRQAEES